MSNLTPFSLIDPYDPESDYTDAQKEAAEFLTAMDYEGGMDGLYLYGGAEMFPEEIRHYAEAYGEAYEALSQAIDGWAAARGVEY